jgi:hypothetical protein
VSAAADDSDRRTTDIPSPAARAVPYRGGNVAEASMAVEVSKPEPIKRYDSPRPLFRGEHWAALGVGLLAWFFTRKHPSLSVRTLGTFVGATLVARAANGHRRMGSVMRWTPIGGGIKRR